MAEVLFNQFGLVSSPRYMSDEQAINPYMDSSVIVDTEKATEEHLNLQNYYRHLGAQLFRVAPVPGLQDFTYTANWALVRGDRAVLARLPNARKGEEVYAKRALQYLGKKVLELPEDDRFSGNGDALPCGNYLFTGKGYRSTESAQDFAAKTLGYTRIQLQTIPLLDAKRRPVRNAASGWIDSKFYDLDLALSVLRQPTETNKGLIAWCPEAFLPGSRAFMHDFDAVDKIEIPYHEAERAFAANLVSNGRSVIMNHGAPLFEQRLRARGFAIFKPRLPEISKGGGSIKCNFLTLDAA